MKYLLHSLGAISLLSVALVPLSASAQFTGANGRIFFVGNGGVIASVKPDGSGKTNLGSLTTGNGTNTVAVTKDGTKIVYTNATGLALALTSTGAETQIDSVATEVEPTWSPNAAKIYAINASGDVISMNADGTAPATVIAHATTFTYSRPVVSPDGTTVFAMMTNSVGNKSDIVSIPAAGGSATNLTNYGPNDFAVYEDVSPDGTKLLLDRVNTTSSTFYLETIPVAGGAATPVLSVATPNPGDLTITTASWSPDGSKIAYSRHASGSGSAQPGFYNVGPLWEANADGTGAGQVLGDSVGSVAWSQVAAASAAASTPGLPAAGRIPSKLPIALGLAGLLAALGLEAARRVRRRA